MNRVNRLLRTGALLSVGGWCGAAMGQPTLTLTPSSSCVHDAGRTVIVKVNMTGATGPIVGGQFFLRYDPAVLTLYGVAPGSAPFFLPVYNDTHTPGLIDFAVGVPGGGAGTSADTTMAVFTFHAINDVCATDGDLVAFRPHTPPTRLTNSVGAAITASLVDMASIRIDSTPPAVSCPPNVAVNAGTGGLTAELSELLGPGWIIDGNASVVNTAGSGVDFSVFLDAHDFTHASAVRYTPQAPLPFNAVTTLSADYNMQCGRFGCGSPHFKLRIDQDGSGGESVGDKNLRIVWGTHPTFDDCPGYGAWLSTGNFIASPTLRFDTSEFPGGSLFDSYSHALSLIGSKRVLRVSIVADENCSAASCTSNCGTTTGGRTLFVDNININGAVQRFMTATATDNCTATPVITAVRDDALPLTDPYPNGQTVITWTATDSCGNASSCDQVITVMGPCPTSDYNCDGDYGTDLDIEDFFRCLAGECPPPPCTSTSDFNGDGDYGTDADIEAFFRVLAGSPC